MVRAPLLFALSSLLTGLTFAGCNAQSQPGGRTPTKPAATKPAGANTSVAKATTPKRTTVRLYSIGHSLSSEIPDMTSALTKATPGLSYSFQEQFRLGASLQAQWEEAQTPRDQYDDKQFRLNYPRALPSGDFNVVVLIDSVPRGGEEQEKQSVEYLTRFARHIAETNPSAQIYYAEPWHSIQSGTGKAQWDTASPTRHLAWRERLDADAPMWERIRAAAAKASGQSITLIPQAKALARLTDAMQAGQVSGFTKLEDIFSDDIHLNPYGMYFLACLHYGVIFGRSPEGLPFDIQNRWGTPYWEHKFYNGQTYAKPSPEAIREMQRIAWQVASGK